MGFFPSFHTTPGMELTRLCRPGNVPESQSGYVQLSDQGYTFSIPFHFLSLDFKYHMWLFTSDGDWLLG